MLRKTLVLLFVSLVEGSRNPVEDGVVDDLILNLPGLSEQPSFNQYSGYLNGIGGNQLHYWFVESEGNPLEDPLVIWFNGGPGCSSLSGLLEGNGPFRVEPDGQNLEFNPYRWNKIANMLYIESPVGVGFSYNHEAEYFSNDTLARDNKYVAIKDFLRRFSDFSDNPLFIFGQSYGGVYAPMLSALIVDDPDINFKGFGVGNGFVSNKYITGSIVNYLYYHGIFGDTMWQTMINDCCVDVNGGFCDFVSCKGGKYVRESYAALGYLVNIYDINADCTLSSHQNTSLTKRSVADDAMEQWFLDLGDGAPRSLASRAISMGYHCVNSTATILYLNDPRVREALHIPRDLPGIREWHMCHSPNVDYERADADVEMAEYFLKVLAKNKRVLMYHGEADIICNYLGGRWFAKSLNQPLIKEHYSWYYRDVNGDKQVGGGFEKFQNLVYVSVKGAGHFVPKQSADKAFVLFHNFLLGFEPLFFRNLNASAFCGILYVAHLFIYAYVL